jgi:farnesyl diphosphate synthase
VPDRIHANASQIHSAPETAGAIGVAEGSRGESSGTDSGTAARLRQALAATAGDIERTLDEILPRPDGGHARVQEAMRYAVFAGGKRLRPFLTVHCAELFGVPRARALRAGAAIEALHTYSLVHDDLPAMDDDDLRRGNPTTHRKFDEATAILAGDGLLTLAFEILADPATDPAAEHRADLVLALGRAAGSEGMVGGQMIDIDAPGHQLTAAEIIDLQRRKTGALFEFSCCAGGILGGARPDEMQLLTRYARDLGLAFQIGDDLLDVFGTPEAAGKQVAKDQAQGKATLVSLWGPERARIEAEILANSAAEALAAFGAASELLRTLPFFLLDRRN